jgi:hypothetical protein
MAANDRHQLLDPVANATAPAISAGRRGQCIRVAINDTAIDDVIECGYDRLLLERSVDSGLTWDEITTPDQRVVLEAGQSSYSIIDSLGETTHLYRTRYIDTSDGDKSEASGEIAGAGLAIRGFLTVAELKQRYLFGIDTTDDAGNELPDAVYEHYIAAAISVIEHELDMPLFPTTFCELHDFYREDYHAFNFLKLDNRPLISVIEFRVQYPSGQTVIVFPQEWLRLNLPEAQIQIVPTAGTLSEILVGQGGSFLPAIYNGLQYLPQLFQVQYIAGFETGKVPRNIIDIVGKIAAMGPFNLFGDLIAGAGIANLSLSLDGLSQTIGTTASATNAGYGARLIQYTKEVKEAIPLLRRYYRGISMVVV